MSLNKINIINDFSVKLQKLKTNSLNYDFILNKELLDTNINKNLKEHN